MKTERQEEGLVMGFGEFRNSVVSDLSIRDGTVIAMDDAKCDSSDAAIFNSGTTSSLLFFTFGRSPLLRESKPTVPQLSHPQRGVAMVFELGDQRLLNVDSLAVGIVIVVNTGRSRSHSGQQRCSRWITHRGCAMGVAEGHSHFGEPVKIRSFRLPIPPEMSHPVVQVVHGNKQDVGPSFLIALNL